MHILYIYTDPTNPENNELITLRTYDALYTDSTTNRPGLKALLQNCSHGDILHISSETHLGDDTWPVIHVLQTLAAKGVDVVIGDRTITASDSPYPAISEAAVKDLRKFHNAFTQHRARNGMRKAMKNGVQIGRPTKPLPAGFEQAARKWYAGETTSMAASGSIGMPFSTFVKKARDLLGERPKRKGKYHGPSER